MNDNQKKPWNDPWGGSPRRPQNSADNVEDAIRKGQERLRKGLGSIVGGGGGGGDFDARKVTKIVAFSGVILVVVWLMTGLYRVQTGQRGVEMVFGAVSEVTLPGLRYNWPAPIGRVFIPEVERSRRFLIGQQQIGSGDNVLVRDVPEQSLILTSDENIVDMDYAVFWKISDPVKYLFNVRDQEEMLKTAAQTSMRDVIGQTSFDLSVTTGRAQIELSALDLLQNIVDSYDAGILVEQVVLQKSDPPSDVIDAFNDVQRARQDRDRMRNEAEAYANAILPRARGEVERILRESEAYQEKLVLESKGEADRFRAILDSYEASRDVVRTRMYYEAMGDVLGSSSRILMSPSSGGEYGVGGVLPYLPLSELIDKSSKNKNEFISSDSGSLSDRPSESTNNIIKTDSLNDNRSINNNR